MCNNNKLRRRSQGLLCLLFGVFVPGALTEAALAQAHHSAVSAVIDENGLVPLSGDQPECLFPAEGVACLADASSLSQLPEPAKPTIVNVEDLRPAPIEFEVKAETLQGTDDRTLSESIVPIPSVTPPAAREEQFEVSDTPVPPLPDRVPFTVEDYVPEPNPISFIEVGTEVATPPDDFIEWRATLWGGVMTDNDLEESITFQGIELEDSGLLGVAISRTLTGGNSLKIEGELQLFRHFGRQDHYEGTAALALRWELSPSFSIALLEGVSYATALPEIEDDNNSDESHFLNYLALEVEYFYTPKWAIAGRLHHRSGAYGKFGDAIGGSNAYLMGLRHRF